MMCLNQRGRMRRRRNQGSVVASTPFPDPTIVAEPQEETDALSFGHGPIARTASLGVRGMRIKGGYSSMRIGGVLPPPLPPDRGLEGLIRERFREAEPKPGRLRGHLGPIQNGRRYPRDGRQANEADPNAFRWGRCFAHLDKCARGAEVLESCSDGVKAPALPPAEVHLGPDGSVPVGSAAFFTSHEASLQWPTIRTRPTPTRSLAHGRRIVPPAACARLFGLVIRLPTPRGFC